MHDPHDEVQSYGYKDVEAGKDYPVGKDLQVKGKRIHQVPKLFATEITEATEISVFKKQKKKVNA